MLSRIIWILIGRHFLKLKVKEFSASVLSFVTNSTFAGNNKLNGRTIIRDSKLGRHTYVNTAIISNVEVGAFCSIGANSMIGGLGRHPVNRISTHPCFYSNGRQSGRFFYHDKTFLETERAYVGNDVWIGANVIVMDGVRIGNGVVIGAGAVITKDVPDYAIIVGVPGKILKMRFSKEEVRMLNTICWWNFSDQKLTELSEFFLNGNVEEMFKRLDIS
jgi:acetyltransferase-like isoleucine patch superfamily enzyme